MPQTKSAVDRGNEIRDFILLNVRKHPKDIVSFTAEEYRISRQAILRHVRKLEEDAYLGVEGATRDRAYYLLPMINYSQEYAVTDSLEEHIVWRDSPLAKIAAKLKPNVRRICQHGITEMVNNVIDHSESKTMHIQVQQFMDMIQIIVDDSGIGIFDKVQHELGLDDPMHVILELSKGKLTTDPETHTGEGIFFTSRMFDVFSVFSDFIYFVHRMESGDWFLENRDKKKDGTCVTLQISPYSERTIQQVFNEYTSGDDYGFNKTKVPVVLAQYGDENLISRSQARRLLARFDRFKQIILDFSDVDMIGQAFADEVFRVFRNLHPDIIIHPLHANDEVMMMIKRAESGQ